MPSHLAPKSHVSDLSIEVQICNLTVPPKLETTCKTGKAHIWYWDVKTILRSFGGFIAFEGNTDVAIAHEFLWYEKEL